MYRIGNELRLPWGQSIVNLPCHATILDLDRWLEIQIKAMSLGELLGHGVTSERKSNNSADAENFAFNIRKTANQRRVHAVSKELDPCAWCEQTQHISKFSRFLGLGSAEEREDIVRA